MILKIVAFAFVMYLGYLGYQKLIKTEKVRKALASYDYAKTDAQAHSIYQSAQEL